MIFEGHVLLVLLQGGREGGGGYFVGYFICFISKVFFSVSFFS